MFRRSILVLIAFAMSVLASGCSSTFEFSGDPAVREPTETPTPADQGSEDQETEGEAPEEETASIDPRPRVEDEETTARIAVQTADGQLFTVQPDGSDRIDLTDPEERRFNRQPTWAPDASRLAWVAIEPSEGSADLRTDRFDLSGPTSMAMADPPFYLNWDPSSSKIAFLAPSVAGIDLGLATIGEESDVIRLDRGEPYFFSWGPDSDELLIHASTFRLDRIDVDGSTRVIEEFPAPFQAPVWLGDEETLVYADQSGGENFLVTTGPLGEGRVELATFDGSLTFSVNPTGTYAALISTDSGNGTGDGGIITTSHSSPSLQDPGDPANPDDPFDEEDPYADIVDELPLDTLGFIALYGGDLTTIAFGEVVAFFWDPTGEILAWLEPSPTTAGALQWWFSDRRDIWGGVEFIPSQTLTSNYLPFFDQYAQSHTFFSPDGTEITFAGQTLNGEQGVFVMGTEPGASARKISDGVFSVWSPDAAASGASVL